MALVLIKEDGTGTLAANSYATAAEGDSYFDGRLFTTAWTAATTGTKEAALVFATTLIDAQFRFSGYRLLNSQQLQWPRQQCPDPDRLINGSSNPLSSALVSNEGFLPSNAVPKLVITACLELARELIVVDRTLPAAGEGQKYYNSGTTITGYDKKDKPPLIPKVSVAMLERYGVQQGGRSGVAQLIRS